MGQEVEHPPRFHKADYTRFHKALVAETHLSITTALQGTLPSDENTDIDWAQITNLPENSILNILTFFDPLTINDAVRITGIVRASDAAIQQNDRVVMSSNHAVEATITRRYPQLSQLLSNTTQRILPQPYYVMAIPRPLRRQQTLILSHIKETNTLVVARAQGTALPFMRIRDPNKDTRLAQEHINRYHDQHSASHIYQYFHDITLPRISKATYLPMQDYHIPLRSGLVTTHREGIEGNELDAQLIVHTSRYSTHDFHPTKLIESQSMMKRMVRRLRWITAGRLPFVSPTCQEGKHRSDRDNFPPPLQPGY
jgi:hypothetical protein